MIRALFGSVAHRARRTLHGHYWTYAGFVLNHLRPVAPADDAPITIALEDASRGPLALRARFALRDPASCVVVLHGLGGDVESRYVRLAVAAAARRGVSSLRLSFRGAELDGADIYHAGLVDDVIAALACPELAGFRRIELVGYSMGGHIALSYAARGAREGFLDPRVSGVAAICAPLDLARGVVAIQRPDRLPYQHHVLRALKAHYRAVEDRARLEGRRLPHPADLVDRAPTLRSWDELVVCPRYGFRDAEDYYERASVGPRLGDITVPTLLAVAEADPMVPIETLEPWIAAASPEVAVWRFERGGHVAFPRGTGSPPPHPRARTGAWARPLDPRDGELEDEVLAWLDAVGPAVPDR